MHDQIGEAPPTEHAALQQGFFNIGTTGTLYPQPSRVFSRQDLHAILNTCWSELGIVVAAAA